MHPPAPMRTRGPWGLPYLDPERNGISLLQSFSHTLMALQTLPLPGTRVAGSGTA